MRILRALVLVLLLGTGVSVTAFSGTAYAAPTCPAGKAAVTSYSYVATGLDGTTRNLTQLRGNTDAGDIITVTFTVAPGCEDVQVSFASYRAAEGSWPTYDQSLYKSSTGFFDAGTHTLTVEVPATPGTAGANCPNEFHDNSNGGGANASPGPYDTTCDGSPSQNGNGDGNANGKPCAGCVGNADNKNPPGQMPNAEEDGDQGYECEPQPKGNDGVGVGNPAHSSCTPYGFYQVDFAVGPVLETISETSLYGTRLIDADNG